MDQLTLIEALHFCPLFQSRHSLEAVPRGTGQISISSCKSLDGGSGGADAGANDEKELVVLG